MHQGKPAPIPSQCPPKPCRHLPDTGAKCTLMDGSLSTVIEKMHNEWLSSKLVRKWISLLVWM